MSKVRVYEVARDLGLDNRELLGKIASLGIQVRNHMSALDATDAERIKRAIEKEKAQNTVEERIRPTVVRRRTVVRSRTDGGAAKPAVSDGSAAATAGTAPARPQPEPQAAPAEAPAAQRAPRAEPAPAARQAEPQPAARQAEVPPRAEPSEAPSEPAAAPVAEPAAAPTPRAPEAPAERAPEPSREAPQAPPAAQAPAARDGQAAPSPAPGAPAAQETPAAAGPAAEEPSGARRRPSQPPPAHVRLAHSNLPPGVVARGKEVAPSAPRPSASTVSRIVSQHQARENAPVTPRRRELGRAAIGPTGRGRAQQGRPGKARKMAPGKKGAKTEITTPSAQKRVIRIEGEIQLQTLAQRMSLKATDVLMKLMQLGMTGVNINSNLDADTAKLLAGEFGYEVENVAVSDDEMIKEARGTFTDEAKDQQGRPPVITVMGHVDHGKTSLLDRIRSAKVAEAEAGGITQHLGAYRVDTGNGTLVFLDTPGHEAFTAMRARGAEATDVVILVVAADDGVMPQTKEAINHAKAAGVPIVVAVNKVDKESARPDQIRTELATEGLQPEEWGGDIIFVDVSAHTGQGLDKLLESVALQAEILELSANPGLPAEGVVLEAYLDRGRGPVANILVENGTLNTGDVVVAGPAYGRVRAMTDDRGKQAASAGPATPVEVLGLSEVPNAGDKIYAVTDAKVAQQLAERRKKGSAKPVAPTTAKVGLDQLFQKMQEGDVQELKLVVKADVAGSTEALVKALSDLSTSKVRVNVIHTGVGGITENDVMLASASNAIVIGFHVRPAGGASATAKREQVEIRVYNIIYEAVDDVRNAMAGLLQPKLVEKELGKAQVRQVFTIPKVGAIAGCYVTDGKILRSGRARLVRDSVQIWEGKVGSLRRFKEDTREVATGYECGIGLENFNDIKEGDVIECFEVEEVQATL